MVILVYNCFLFFMLISLSFCQQDLPENSNATKSKSEIELDENVENVSHPAKSSTTKTTSHHNYHQQRFKHENNKHHFVNFRRQKLPSNQNNLPIFEVNNFEESLPIPNIGGRYNVRLHNQPLQNPIDFNTALGAISAHIVSQKAGEEYIPFPPNGNPYNYPPYRGYHQFTESPAIRAFGAVSDNGFDSQSTANLHQYDPIFFHNNGYGFPNQYDNIENNFYNSRNFFQGEGGFTARTTEPFEEFKSFYQEGEVHYGSPLDRTENF